MSRRRLDDELPKPPLARTLRAGAVAVAAACAVLSFAASAADPVAADEPAHVHTTVRGDTLIGLGRRYLVDAVRWPELARVNGLRNPNRIATGATLRIPYRLMSSDPVPATLVSVVGEVRGAGQATMQAGQPVAEGGEVNTGADGHVTIRLVDGTVLRLRPASRLQVSESRRLRDAAAVQSGARLERGRVEVEAAPAPAGRPGFRIHTPQGVLGVRGTEFRVAVDTERGVTRGEVLGGVVAVQGHDGALQRLEAGPGAVRLDAGQGTLIGATGQVAVPVRLLGMPDVSVLPALQERLLVRFPLTAMDGAAAYRGQVALDAGFERVLADLTSATPELRFAGLPDGDYLLRVRAIDGQGLEGRDADFRFRLKARPEAPLPSAPAPKAVLFGDRVELAWAANAEAQHYRLRLSQEPDFKTVLRDLKDVRGLQAELGGLVPGTYHWQLASVRGEGDQGPWGAVRSFDIRPVPAAPSPPRIGDQSINFSWEGLPGQTFEFQVAREPTFAQPVLVRQLDQPSLDLPLPGTGRFYVRLRARDPDGFVGPFTTPQHFDVPNCMRDSAGQCVRAADSTLNLLP
ncbi:FecR domain-containing protein [Ideonella sp. A 288]|uniref:FecR family protein n=1 Tax=Ideonella sp. A 288 TaxID=1962181 RepID=UPI001184B488|nr:FecR domain-containing protein [Ideonella sp. A 288]